MNNNTVSSLKKVERVMREFNARNLISPSQAKYHEVKKLIPSFARLELEIGAGVGLHPILRAKEDANTLVVGVERTKEKAEKFLRRVVNNNLPNVIAVHADVVPWLWFFDHQIQFDQIWILYPNPEMGNKNQRWIHAPFMGHLVKRLKSSSKIIIATNINSYADEVENFAEKNWNLKVQRFQYLGAPRTHFEKKYLERSEKCFELHLIKD